jgi:hypothetical protein
MKNTVLVILGLTMPPQAMLCDGFWRLEWIFRSEVEVN